MSEILFHYQKINPTTWAYLSSLLMVGLFFQFNRFWSVRNLDLVLLILLAPGLLMVNQAREEAAAKPLAAVAVENELAASPTIEVPAPVADVSASGDANQASPRVQMEYAGYLWLFAVS